MIIIISQTPRAYFTSQVLICNKFACYLKQQTQDKLKITDTKPKPETKSSTQNISNDNKELQFHISALLPWLPESHYVTAIVHTC